MGKRGPPKGQGGAPVIPIDEAVMRRAASIGCTADEIAALLGVARATFYNRLKDDPSLQVALDEARESGKATLRRLQWQRATAGSDTMCIWLGKQLLGQRDRQEDADRQPDQSMRVVVEFVGDAGPPTLDHAPQPDDRARVTDLRKHVQLVG